MNDKLIQFAREALKILAAHENTPLEKQDEWSCVTNIMDNAFHADLLKYDNAESVVVNYD